MGNKNVSRISEATMVNGDCAGKPTDVFDQFLRGSQGFRVGLSSGEDKYGSILLKIDEK